MNSAATSLPRPAARRFHPDRLGVFASVLCAIHCACTPLLIFATPAFGEIWAHPASHWLAALLVVPLALVMTIRGYRQHRRSWVVACGAAGVALVLAGAVIPYRRTQGGIDSPELIGKPAKASHFSAEEAGEESDSDFVFVVGADDLSDETDATCADTCCPGLVKGEDGKTRLHIPPASLVTTLGGIALILTHLGNLCCCAGCRKRDPAAM